MLDAVSGSNHIRNTRGAGKRLAMVSMTGVCLTICLPLGLLNGPGDFQRMMHKVFRSKLYRVLSVSLDGGRCHWT